MRFKQVWDVKVEDVGGKGWIESGEGRGAIVNYTKVLCCALREERN